MGNQEEKQFPYAKSMIPLILRRFRVKYKIISEDCLIVGTVYSLLLLISYNIYEVLSNFLLLFASDNRMVGQVLLSHWKDEETKVRRS